MPSKISKQIENIPPDVNSQKPTTSNKSKGQSGTPDINNQKPTTSNKSNLSSDQRDTPDINNQKPTTSNKSNLSSGQSGTPRRRRVHFSIELEEKELEKAFLIKLEQCGKLSLWMVFMLLLCNWSYFAYALHDAFFLIKQLTSLWCLLPDEKNTNWTVIKNILGDRYETACSINYVSALRSANGPYMDANNNLSGRVRRAKQIIADHSDRNFDAIFTNSAINENLWNLVLGGRIVTDFVCGAATDVYGRKRIAYFTTGIFLMGTIIIISSGTVWVLLLGRLLAVVGGHSSKDALYLVFMELCSTKVRPFLGLLFNVGGGFGYIVGPVIMIFVQNWQYLHCIVLFAGLILMFCVWFIPESPRWYLAYKRYGATLKVVRRMDKKMDADFSIPDKLTVQKPSFINNIKIFINPDLRKRIALVVFAYSAVFVANFQTHITSNDVEINHFGFNILYGTILVILPLGSCVLVVALGRKLSCCVLFAFASICNCLSFSLLSFSTTVTLSVLIKTFLINCMFINVMQIVELFPVSHIGTILGFCRSVGVFFVILESFLMKYVHFMNKTDFISIIHMIFTFGGVVVVIFLPETTDKVLPLSENDAIDLKSYAGLTNYTYRDVN